MEIISKKIRKDVSFSVWAIVPQDMGLCQGTVGRDQRAKPVPVEFSHGKTSFLYSILQGKTQEPLQDRTDKNPNIV